MPANAPRESVLTHPLSRCPARCDDPAWQPRLSARQVDRLLRYVDVPDADSSDDDLVADIGYSLLLGGLAVPRYDYQWRPRPVI